MTSGTHTSVSIFYSFMTSGTYLLSLSPTPFFLHFPYPSLSLPDQYQDGELGQRPAGSGDTDLEHGELGRRPARAAERRSRDEAAATALQVQSTAAARRRLGE